MSTTRRRAHPGATVRDEGEPSSVRRSGNDVLSSKRRKPSGCSSRPTGIALGIGLSTLLICISVWILHLPERLQSTPHRIRRGEVYPSKIEWPSPSDLNQRVTPSPPIQADNGKLLALLYPPGLMGGYRNQVLRFVGFVVYAIKSDISHLFLPSLMWTTQILIDDKEEWVPIPMDLVMDVDYWNQVALSIKDTKIQLPFLTDYDPLQKYDCWSRTEERDIPSNATALAQTVLRRGFLSPIVNESFRIATQQGVVNPRKIDFMEQVQNCTQPSAYGGGRGAGRLWNDVMGYLKKPAGIPYGADALVLRALRPKRAWRELAMQCVASHTGSSGADTSTISTDRNYVALHARVELEMMDHNCGKTMEKNLTKIFDMMGDFLTSHPRFSESSPNGVFVAVSRSGMEETGRLYQKFQTYADENLSTINRIVGVQDTAGAGLLLDREQYVSVFECGQKTMDQYYREHPDSIDYGSLLQSVVNFFIATEATAFVGVRGSSYSTDIWTTRYHQGRGNTNFEYTPEGIIPMENSGLPPPHKNCKNK